MDRLVHIVNAGLLALLIGGSLWLFPGLPDQVPRHFGIGGTADAYWEATLLHWMGLPCIAVAVAALVYGAAWWIGTPPYSISVPNQQQYDMLDPSDKRVVIGHVQAFLHWTATAMLALFLVAQWSTYQVAMSGASTLPGYGLAVSLGMPVVLVIAALGMAWWLPRRVRKLSGES
ncbi:MAG: DUF1648 domain-containing protein [Bacteroidetes bacterium QH_10_64_19]|nr:MAG: DUF1648 domain-containing protein [Bacteroidetes bacterium QH_10_64_19]